MSMQTIEVLSLWRGRMLVSRRSARLPLSTMAESFCLIHGLHIGELRGPGRARDVSWPRQQFMAEAHATGFYSLPRIGNFLNRDHTTILHGIRAYRDRMQAARDAESYRP